MHENEQEQTREHTYYAYLYIKLNVEKNIRYDFAVRLSFLRYFSLFKYFCVMLLPYLLGAALLPRPGNGYIFILK